MIYVVEAAPDRCAQSLCDQDLRLVTLRAARILSTVLRGHGFAYGLPAQEDDAWTAWAGRSRGNLLWLAAHLSSLIMEHVQRVGATDPRCFDVCEAAVTFASAIPAGPMSLWPEPEGYNTGKPIQSWRAWYCREKHKHARWSEPAERPPWFEEVYDEVAHSLDVRRPHRSNESRERSERPPAAMEERRPLEEPGDMTN